MKPMPVIVCAHCGRTLTEPLHGAPLDSLEPGDVKVRACTWVIDPEARTVRVGSFRGKKQEWTTQETDPPRCIVVNPADRLSHAMTDIPEHSAGCCGLDGCDGPNQACSNCGRTLGTARTDCWTEKEMRFWPEAVVPR